jgi:MFS family permease
VRLQGRYATRVTAAVVVGLALAVAGLTTRPALLVSMFGIVGLANAAMTLVGKTHRMLARPLAFRARMSAGAVTTIQVAQTLGPALAGVALAHASVRGVYVSFGLLGALASLGFTVVPGFRAFMALDHHEVENWYGRTYPHVFGADGATAGQDGR